MKGARKRVLEGYLYYIPYVGDRWVLTPKSYGTPPCDFKEFWKWRDMLDDERPVDDLLDGLEGKKVRITVEVVEEGERK